jgi:hypothetical protein
MRNSNYRFNDFKRGGQGARARYAPDARNEDVQTEGEGEGQTKDHQQKSTQAG